MIKEETIIATSSCNEQVKEATHWAIQFGEIILPTSESLLIETFSVDMNILLCVLFRIYIRALTTGDYVLAAKMTAFFPRLIDPYIPGICAEAGINNSGDEYLDSIDDPLQI